MEPEAMTCNTVREMVQRDHYGETVMAHLPECEQCLDVAVNRVLADRQDISVPPAFAYQVLARINALPTPAAACWAREALWPTIVAVCAGIGAVFLQDLSAFAQSLWGTAVLGAASMEISLIIVWVLGWNRSALVLHR